jgi:CubicO group peptidase (beta-lactamase class C family)
VAVLAVVGVGVLLTGILGLFVYVNVTTKPIHPDAQSVPSEAYAAAASPRWTNAIAQARQSALTGLAEQNLPGLSVAVGADGELVWAEGFGWADLDDRVKVTPDTRFRIGTASKMLTSAAVGLLMEQQRLSLDDLVQAHVPSFPQKPWPVTLRQLMGHTAGIRRDEGDEEPVHARCGATLDALPRFADSELLFEPGTEYRYSSYGWILVSGSVESASGERFDAFMRKQVFEPLGLRDTRTDAIVGTNRGQATYYFPRFAADPRYGPQEPDQEDFSCFAGASAFVSTPSDLVRFGLAMEKGTLLRPDTVELLRTSQRLRNGEATGYGLGWDLETVQLAGTPTRAVGYDGALRDGIVMSFISLPDHDLVVAVTSNTSFADTPSLALKIAEAFVLARSAAARP